MKTYGRNIQEHTKNSQNASDDSPSMNMPAEKPRHPELDWKLVGHQVKKYREIRGLSQAELAALSGHSLNSISRLEAPGICFSVRLQTLLDITDVLKITPDLVLSGNYRPEYSTLEGRFMMLNEAVRERTAEAIDEVFDQYIGKIQEDESEEDLRESSFWKKHVADNDGTDRETFSAGSFHLNSGKKPKKSY